MAYLHEHLDLIRAHLLDDAAPNSEDTDTSSPSPPGRRQAPALFVSLPPKPAAVVVAAGSNKRTARSMDAEECLREVKKERVLLDKEPAADRANWNNGPGMAADYFWEEVEGTICSLPPLSPLSPHPHLAFSQLPVN